jgi:hypothetical protein
MFELTSEHVARIEPQRFHRAEKTMVAERVRPFGPPPAFDPSTSTLIGTSLFASS